jgi:hypothetical protein
MNHILERNFGISSDTNIRCDDKYLNFKEILINNELDLSDFESDGIPKTIKLSVPFLVNLSHSDIEIKEIYYAGYQEFQSVVLSNGIQIKLSNLQPILITTPTQNRYKAIQNIDKTDEIMVLNSKNKYEYATILSRNSLGAQPTWSPFKYNNNSYILENGLILC